MLISQARYWKSAIALLLCWIVLIALTGCAKRHVVLFVAEEPIAMGSTCTIGGIGDRMPEDTDLEAKPSLEDIQFFKSEIAKHLNERDLLRIDSVSPDTPPYEVRGDVLGHSRGSWFLRAFLGLGLGAAELTTDLRVVRMDTNIEQTVFEAVFKQKVHHWTESRRDLFRKMAKDFAKALDKHLKDEDVVAKQIEKTARDARYDEKDKERESDKKKRKIETAF